MPSYLVLARKYRPSRFDDVIGQDHVIQTLRNSIVSGRVGHAFLFCGVRGVGKTTVARVLAKALNCSGREANDPNPCNHCRSCHEITQGISVDVQEIDGASHTSVENIREINENIKYPPVSSPLKIIIIDEVHMISINAFNALLKTLEEPPPHAKFMFATTESHKVPATIHSRCQRFNFRTIALRDIINGMTRILSEEGINASEDALALVAREAQGSFRDALSLLDQVIALCSDNIGAEDVMDILGIAGRESFARLTTAILDRDAATALGIMGELFRGGYNPEQFVVDMIQYLRNLIVVRTVPTQSRPEGMVDATSAEVEELESLGRRASVEELQNLLAMLFRSEGEVKRAGNPWVALEMTVLRMAHAPNIVDLSEIIRRLSTVAPAMSVPLPATRKESNTAGPRAKPRVSRRQGIDSAPDEAAVFKGSVKQLEREPQDRFVIEEVTPLPTGTTDEIWLMLKEKLKKSAGDNIFISVLDHADLISVGPAVVEIGFSKSFYKEQFEARWAGNQDIKQIFRDFFGNADIKTLTLAQETSLRTSEPYDNAGDGETDRNRALKQEALDHPIVRAVQEEFEDSAIQDIKILS